MAPIHRLSVRRRRHKKWFVKVFLLAIIIVSLVYASRNDLFLIDEVSVTGAETIGTAVVRDFIEKEISGNFLWLFPKRNFVWYPKDGILDRLVSTFPKIKNISIDLNRFSTLQIHVSEHSSQLVWCDVDQLVTTPDGFCYFITTDGFAFEKVDSNVKNVFIIRSKAISERVLGTEVIDPKRLASLLIFKDHVAQVLSFTEGTVEEGDDYSLKTSHGVRILFSGRKDIRESAEDLLTLLASSVFDERNIRPLEHFEKIDYIDLRFGKKIFYKVKR